MAGPRNLFRLDLSGEELRALRALVAVGAEAIVLGRVNLTPEERTARAVRVAGDAMAELVGIEPMVAGALLRRLEALAESRGPPR